MKNLLLNLYRKITPFFLRHKISIFIFEFQKYILRKNILKYYSTNNDLLKDPELNEVINYLKKNKISVFPYKFQENYISRDVTVFLDKSCGLRYVLHKNKKLYFKRSWNDLTIKNYYCSLLIEQDRNSPHLYLTNNFFVENGSVFVDIGAAEGIISLDVIEEASKIYLFEVNSEWIEALNATFSMWPEKVIIINKYASNNSFGNSITLDDYFKDKLHPNFLKIDVDGSESIVLEGCLEIIKNSSSIKLAICTYHKQNDANIFSNFLMNLGFVMEFSKGYMLFFCDSTKLTPPYFVKGILRATKTINN
jgi:hypothetical protein